MDRGVYAMRDLLMKHGVAHRWFDPADPVDGPVAAHLLAERGLTQDQLPVAILGAAEVLVQPTPEQLAAGLGLDLLPDGAPADVLVVGSGRSEESRVGKEGVSQCRSGWSPYH